MSDESGEAVAASPVASPRGWIIFLMKAAVTVSLIVWLVRSGALEVKRLSIFVESTRVLAVTCAAWLCMQVGLATWRWRALLVSIGVEVPPARGAALQTTALFFNALVPGNVGGDFIKNQAVLGNQAAKLFVMVVVERTVGLISLVWAGGLGVLLSVNQVSEHTELIPVASAVLILIAGSVIGPWVLVRLLHGAQSGGAGEHLEAAGIIGFLRRSLGSVVEALQLIRDSKPAVARAFAVSFAMHLGNMAYFLFLTRELGNPDAAFNEIAMVFPLGMLTLIVPISISGFGVGHVMFNELFQLLGLVGGATIFNVYIVAQIAPCILGAVPYLFMKNQPKPKPG